VKWDDQSLRVPAYYGLRADHWFGREGDWGSSADFTHCKIFADRDASVRERGSWQGVVVGGPVRFGDRAQGFSSLFHIVIGTGYRFQPRRHPGRWHEAPAALAAGAIAHDPPPSTTLADQPLSASGTYIRFGDPT
jgi:hypothetical protein